MTFPPLTPPRLHIEVLDCGEAAQGAMPLLAGVFPATGPRGEACVQIKAWLPDLWAGIEVNGSTSESDWMNDYCEDCPYHCSTRTIDADELRQYWSDDEGIDWEVSTDSVEVYSPCPAYSDGLSAVSWPCHGGHDEPNLDRDTIADAGPTVFSAVRVITAGRHSPPFRLVHFTAAHQKVAKPDDGRWRSSFGTNRVLNAYAPDDNICWGNDNDAPASLAEAITQYAGTPANDDLLKINEYHRNLREVREARAIHPLEASRLLEITPAEGRTIGVAVATAAGTPEAFLLLSACGAQCSDGNAFCQVTWHDAIPLGDGTTVSGWLSAPLAGGQCLLMATEANDDECCEAFVIGQIPDPFTTPTTPCSTAPSSLELAAPAAS